MRYDPDVAPSSPHWLALDEAERMVLVERSHDPAIPNLRVHAAIHATVETHMGDAA